MSALCLTATTIAKKLPAFDGEEISPATLRRWIRSGILWNGERVRLKAERIGGRWAVQQGDLDRFLAILNGNCEGV
jgi:hypothetical protein